MGKRGPASQQARCINISMPKNMMDRLRKEAHDKKLSTSAYIRSLIREAQRPKDGGNG